MSPPLILVTNDDGIRSTGIKALASALEVVGEVVVVAPAHQQSAASHKITLDAPLRVRRVAPGRIAVAGTPADAVFLALHRLLPRTPDLVVSGINHGLNLGTDVFYSGTVAAAMEAALKGIPAIAVSQQLARSGDDDAGEGPGLSQLLEHAARFSSLLARTLLASPLPAGMALNVNVPSCLGDGFCWTTVGERIYSGEVVERVDPRGVPYYWVGGAVSEPDGPVGTDSRAVRDGLISISPLAPDWNTTRPEELAGWSFDGFQARDLANP